MLLLPSRPLCPRQAKQKWHITLDRSFPATANARNEAMMKEAGEFAVHLKRCEKDIRTLKNATEGTSQVSDQAAECNSPHPLPASSCVPPR